MGVLTEIQCELKVPKGRMNSFGGYKYRSAEDILEAAKPILKKHEATLTISDTVEQIGDRIYVKATAEFQCAEESARVTAYAREAETKRGMDDSQITGTASSYARKYCLNGLFLIDDTKDPDSDEYDEEVKNLKKKEETALKKIGKIKASALEARIKSIKNVKDGKETGVDIGGLKDRYEVKDLSDLTEEQHNEIIRMLGRWEKK